MPPPRFPDDFERWRGKIDATLDELRRMAEQHQEELKDEREESRKHRQALRDVIGSLSMSVTTLSDSVKEMKPVVSILEANRHRAQGFVWALRAFWILVGSVLGAALTKFGWR